MLEAKNITFSWGRNPLLDGVSFRVDSGEVAVLAGANGAGKTTLMRILAGLAAPRDGYVLADGSDTALFPLKFRRQLGWMGENPFPDPDMRVAAYLKYRAKIKGEMKKKIRHRVKEAMNACALEEWAEARIGLLSPGVRKRVALADAILLRPKYLLLDDLFAGIDTVNRAAALNILENAKNYSTVIVSGHELDELDCAADKFIVLKGGRIIQAVTAAGAKAILSGMPEKERAEKD